MGGFLKYMSSIFKIKLNFSCPKIRIIVKVLDSVLCMSYAINIMFIDH